jgi:nicotinamidase-related amidase
LVPIAGVDPQRTALMIMDFQTDIVRLADDSDALLERMVRARSTCRRLGIQTIYVRVALTPDDRAADRDYRLFVLGECCADPDPLVHDVLIERVLPRQAEVITSNSLDGLLAGEPIE